MCVRACVCARVLACVCVKSETSTRLSRHTCLWRLKDGNKPYSIRWCVVRRAASYSNISERCNLCLAEKLKIAWADKTRSLNKRSELVSKCRHENKFYLGNFSCCLCVCVCVCVCVWCVCVCVCVCVCARDQWWRC